MALATPRPTVLDTICTRQSALKDSTLPISTQRLHVYCIVPASSLEQKELIREEFFEELIYDDSKRTLAKEDLWLKQKNYYLPINGGKPTMEWCLRKVSLYEEHLISYSQLNGKQAIEEAVRVTLEKNPRNIHSSLQHRIIKDLIGWPTKVWRRIYRLPAECTLNVDIHLHSRSRCLPKFGATLTTEHQPDEDAEDIKQRVVSVLSDLRATDAPSRMHTIIEECDSNLHKELVQMKIFREMKQKQPTMSKEESEKLEEPDQWNYETMLDYSLEKGDYNVFYIDE
ncbi:hypothetical protein PROFUN_02932 [Planoprotostelium fungivorum]|uniref:Uncharacterized protein n=1 Tax=Planoprotostelium fungivorum TaxID=1890364 RepID=A0A2P6NS33_9EUKA|nr:hypothetical protein PROFUN_02932 [Planoprotostelium fungivorum]